jgi:PAS domain S-box-containing protein
VGPRVVSQSLAADMIENLTCVVYSVDTDGVFTFLNKACTEISGYSPEELVGQNVFTVGLLYPADRNVVEQTLQKAMNEIRTNPEIRKISTPDIEFRIRHRNGQIRWLRTSGGWANRDGNGLQLGGVFTDITRERAASESIRRQAETLEVVTETAGMFLSSRNFTDVLSATLARMGESVGAERLRVTRNSLRGGLWADTVREWCTSGIEPVRSSLGKRVPLRHPRLKEIRHRLRKNLPFAEVLRNNTRLGRTLKRYADLTAYVLIPLKQQNELWGALCLDRISRHVPWGAGEVQALRIYAEILSAALERQSWETERDEIIRTLRESQTSLAEALAARDSFFSIVAHDLKGPITGYVNLTETLQKSLDDGTDINWREVIPVMKESACRIYRLLDDLLEWSRLQLGTDPHNPKPCRVNECAQTAADACRSALRSKEITFTVPSLNLEVYADPNALSTVLRNLISNAVKFTGKSGTITVEAHPCSVPADSPKADSPEPDCESANCSDHAEYIEISVSDTGLGMTYHDISRLFRPGEGTQKAGTDGEKGHGLGLIICRQILHRHDSELRVESTPGQGSRFSFQLPVPPNA